MRIDGNSQATIFGVQPVVKSSETEKSRYSRSVQSSDSPFHVQLTDLMSKVGGVQASSGEIRWDKVNQIKEQLAQGAYNISGQDVAAKIMKLFEE